MNGDDLMAPPAVDVEVGVAPAGPEERDARFSLQIEGHVLR